MSVHRDVYLIMFDEKGQIIDRIKKNTKEMQMS